jgi:protein SCO1/2
MEWIPGNQFRHLAISFQPDETPVIAKEKHNAYLRELGKNVENEGWVFLTASPQNITKLMNQLGFRYRWDEKTKQYAHASAIYVLSPKGMITRILPGVDFPPRDIKLALLEATRGEVGDFVDRFALFCFQYDPTKNTYTLYAINLMRMFAGLTLLLVGGYLFYFWSKISMNQSKQGVN